MKQIGLQCYRTSLNWARFLTDYENVVVDEEYAAYFEKMIDACRAAGVEPMICLEHYELPGELFTKYGGWGSKHVVRPLCRGCFPAVWQQGEILVRL